MKSSESLQFVQCPSVFQNVGSVRQLLYDFPWTNVGKLVFVVSQTEHHSTFSSYYFIFRHRRVPVTTLPNCGSFSAALSSGTDQANVRCTLSCNQQQDFFSYDKQASFFIHLINCLRFAGAP